MNHSSCVTKCMSIYNKTHNIRQNFSSLPECFAYYRSLHTEYLKVIEEIRLSYFKHAVEDGKFFVNKCLTFYTIDYNTDEMDVSYVYAYLFWNCIDLECDCIKLNLLLVPILLFQKVLFYKQTHVDKKYKSFVAFRDTLKDLYEIVLKGEKQSPKCGYFNTLLSNTLTKIKRLDDTIQSIQQNKNKGTK